MTVRLIGYLRVHDDVPDVDTLEAALRQAVEQHEDWQLVELVRDESDGLDGLRRPGIQRALRGMADHWVDGIVVARLDQLTTSPPDLADLLDWLENAGARLVVLDHNFDTSTDDGRRIAAVLTDIASWQRKTTSARTRAALARIAEGGGPTGRPAVSDRPELAERIRSMREQGMSLRTIAGILNDEGVPTLRGGSEWRASSVQHAAGYKRPARKRHPRRAGLPPIDPTP